jgi:hypothetical protein
LDSKLHSERILSSRFEAKHLVFHVAALFYSFLSQSDHLSIPDIHCLLSTVIYGHIEAYQTSVGSPERVSCEQHYSTNEIWKHKQQRNQFVEKF